MYTVIILDLLLFSTTNYLCAYFGIRLPQVYILHLRCIIMITLLRACECCKVMHRACISIMLLIEIMTVTDSLAAVSIVIELLAGSPSIGN